MVRIIFKADDSRVAVIIPSQEALDLYGIDAIAKKDVPAGKPYKIIDASMAPPDRSLRDAWTVDDTALTDGVGAEASVFEAIAGEES